MIKSPYPESDLRNNTKDVDNILVLGSKLSAIDAALILLPHRPNLTIEFASMSGTLPCVRDALLVHAAGRFSAKDILVHRSRQIFAATIRTATKDIIEAKHKYNVKSRHEHKDVEVLLADGIVACDTGQNYWQSSIGSFIDEINKIWPWFSTKEQFDFKAKFQDFNSRKISAFPVENAAKILAAMKRNQLFVSSIDIDQAIVVALESGFVGLGQLAERHYGKIVNAIGVDCYTFASSSIGQALYSQGWRLNVHGGLWVDSDTMRMKNDCEMKNLIYAVGAPVSGSILVTNYLRSSVLQAKKVVDDIQTIVRNYGFT